MATLSADKTYVTVVKGDTLSQIAVDFSSQSGGKTYQQLAKLNNIDNPDLIYVGQKIKLTGTADPIKSSTTSRVTISAFGLQANTDRTVFATWTWSKSYTDHYECIWYYATGNGVWFVGSESDETNRQSIYNAPSNATKVKFKVKPVSKKKKVNNKEVSYWTGSWSTEKTYNFSDNPPEAPTGLSLKIDDDCNLTCAIKWDAIKDLNAESIQFQVRRADTYAVYKVGTVAIKNGSALTYTCKVDNGCEYIVRARAYRDKSYSVWSDYTDIQGSVPQAPATLTVKTVAVNGENEVADVYLQWSAVKIATGYIIGYSPDKESYLGTSDNYTEVTVDAYAEYTFTGLEAGKEYFFRVKAVKDSLESDWSSVASVILGCTPEAPTTWSSVTTATINIEDGVELEPVTLYWLHNSKDGSHQTKAMIMHHTNPDMSLSHSSLSFSLDENPTTDDMYNPAATHHHVFSNIDTFGDLGYEDGETMYWKVRTAGITGEYGEWSTVRAIKFFAKPSLDLTVIDSTEASFTELTAFPMRVLASVSPETQDPISFALEIVANDAYETTDNVGNVKMVSAGEMVYSKYFDTNGKTLDVTLSAHDVDLENNISYTLRCRCTTTAGLIAENQFNFTVTWTDIEYEPNAEIGVDPDTLVAYIRPYCEDDAGVPFEGVYLSVYRREYDGSFIEINNYVENDKETYIVDPHPSLDYARYRIVAITEATGAVSFCDVPGYPVGEHAIVIQWNDKWSTFDTSEESELASPPWTGSMLKLPYNVDVTESPTIDVSLIKYIGRTHPVSYYGTQRGESATWKTEIPKTDNETLYALRRLAIWPGDVYVREPSGVGYWASISVAMDQQHRGLTIPVTFTLTRVEGGM